MKKKTWIIVMAIFALSALAVILICHGRFAPQNVMSDVLGDEVKRQPGTTIFDLVYYDARGNAINYYICATTYSEADTNYTVGLNTEAIATVIDPNEAESCQECAVSGLPAAFYQKDGRSYLCWTIMPELSCVIAYNPAIVSEEDMLRMAESVSANTANLVNP